MIRNLLAALALVAAGTFTISGLAQAGDTVPSNEAPKTEAPAAAKSEPAPATTAPEAAKTKTPSPMHTLMGFVAKQVAPSLECPCPAKPEGEKAWRAWFAGGASVPMAALRDQLVADGWTADAFVGFFQKMASKQCGDCSKGDCAKGDCANKECCKGEKKDGCCEGKGERADGKPCCKKCKDGEAKTAPAAPGTAAPEKPAEPAPSKP